MLRPWLSVEELCRCVLAAARKSSSRILSTELDTSIDVGHMRQLRKVLAGSRYQIINYRSLGYELIAPMPMPPWVGPKSETPADRQRKREREPGADRKVVP